MTTASQAVAIRAFDDDVLDEAAALLARRHRTQRLSHPLLPERYEHAESAREALEAAWRKEGASGAAAFRGGALAGYLLGAPDEEEDQWGGAHVWVEFAGQATDEPELARELYAVAADRWLDEGWSRHYVIVPASDTELLDAWSRLCFGQQQAHGVRTVTPENWPEDVREAGPDDVDVLIELAAELRRLHLRAPVFSARRTADDVDAVRRSIEESIGEPQTGVLVVERGGRVVAGLEVLPTELLGATVEGHHGLARPDDSCFLSFAATAPESRGTGAGVALTNAAVAWAARAGFRAIVTDWRMTNLEASRFWPRRGFRETFLRLYRSIP